MLQAHALVPLAEAPRGKFVLLRGAGRLHFVCGPMNRYPYHANIVYAFLQEGGRGEAEMRTPALCRILSSGWDLLGGGYYELDHSHSLLLLNGKSTAYGKYPVELLLRVAGDLPAGLGFPGFGLKAA